MSLNFGSFGGDSTDFDVRVVSIRSFAFRSISAGDHYSLFAIPAVSFETRLK